MSRKDLLLDPSLMTSSKASDLIVPQKDHKEAKGEEKKIDHSHDHQRPKKKRWAEILAWLPEKDSLESFGHVAVGTYSQDENETITEETYASFYPKKAVLSKTGEPVCDEEEIGCESHQDHFHSRIQDYLTYQGDIHSRQAQVIKIYTLDVDAIDQKFKEFKKNPNPTWSIFGSYVKSDDKNTKNCAGLCFTLLEAGGLFSRLGYQNNKGGTYYLPGWGFVGGVSGPAVLTMVLVGGALGGALGPGGAAIGAGVSLLSWYIVTVQTTKLVKEICTPREVYAFVKKIQEVETVLLNPKIGVMVERIQQEILRLRGTKKLGVFIDGSAKDKAIHLEAALLRAQRASGLTTIGDFLLYSYQGMGSIFDEINALRSSSLTKNISRVTTTFKNLMIVEGLEDVLSRPTPR